MYQIDFISAECYPAAKVGGLADVVGSLPKYINKIEDNYCRVVIPKYGTPWFQTQKFKQVFQAFILLDGKKQKFNIEKADCSVELGFDLFVINLPGLFDRNGIYASDNVFFEDEPVRNIAFQRAYLEWISSGSTPDIIHCHDHHTGLIPYMISKCETYEKLKMIPTVFTIHNGQYHGAFSWEFERFLPDSSPQDKGLLDWEKGINPLSSAIRCAWKVTTVSPQYMKELASLSGTFQDLYASEANKLVGILNGIDTEVWDPTTDSYLDHHLVKSLSRFKSSSKKYLTQTFGLDPIKPLLTFIGRFAQEKGVDVLLDAMEIHLKNKVNASFLILGTGDNLLESRFEKLAKTYPNLVYAALKYDEKLAHQIYAGADFLLMPSRVEPCGLNQMFAMRYGTIPIVHGVGGLEDTVFHFDAKNKGNGIKFYGLQDTNILQAFDDAVKLYKNKSLFNQIRNCAYETDLSWDVSCQNYRNLYYELKKSS